MNLNKIKQSLKSYQVIIFNLIYILLYELQLDAHDNCNLNNSSNKNVCGRPIHPKILIKFHIKFRLDYSFNLKQKHT